MDTKSQSMHQRRKPQQHRLASRSHRRGRGRAEDHAAEILAAVRQTDGDKREAITVATEHLTPEHRVTDSPSNVEGHTEVGEGSHQTICRQQELAQQQLKEYESLVQSTASLMGAPTDIPPPALASTLAITWSAQLAENSHLKAESSHLKTQNGQLRDENGHLVAENGRLKTENSQLKDENSQLKAELAQLRAENARTEDRLKTLTSVAMEITGNKEGIPPTDVVATHLKSSWSEMKVQCDELMSSWETKYGALREEMQATVTRLENLANDAGLAEDILDGEVCDVIAAIGAKFDELRQEKEALRDVKDFIAECIEKIEALQNELFAAQAAQQLGLQGRSKRRGRGAKLRNWWKRFWRRRSNRVDVLTSEDNKAESEEHLKASSMLALQARIRSLERDKVIMTGQLKELARKERGWAKEDKALREKIQRLDYDNSQQEDLIKQLRDVVFMMSSKTAGPKSLTYGMTAAMERAFLAMVKSDGVTELDPFKLTDFNYRPVTDGQLDLKAIGKGTYGVVLLARLQGIAAPVVIKQANGRPGLDAEKAERLRKLNIISFRKEAVACRVFSESPYFPSMLGTVYINEETCIVTEFIGDKTNGVSYILANAINKGHAKPVMPKWNLVAIAEDVARGLHAMHERKLLHNDLKEDNVLLEHRGERWHGVIIDLGMVSTFAYSFCPPVSETTRKDRLKNTDCFRHVATEIILKNRWTSVATDIYSLGFLLKCIAGFISEDELMALGESCCHYQPYLRPRKVGDVIPALLALKQKLLKKEKEEGGAMVHVDRVQAKGRAKRKFAHGAAKVVTAMKIDGAVREERVVGEER